MKVAIPRRVPCLYLVFVSIIAAAYWATGRLSLLLAIPPGYATAIWPPAGIALAATLVGGTRVWPGIVVGSFLVNISTAFDATTTVSLLQSIALPTSIGVGAALQATVGAVLVRRFVGFPTALDRQHDVAVFLTLGGPVSCLVGATWGVTSLLIGGSVAWVHALFNWWTWWVGDTIGALIVMPLLLVWTAEPRQVWRRRQLSVAVPLGIAFGLVVIFFVYARSSEQYRIKLDFERRAHTLAHTLRDSFDGYLDVLHSIASFYASAPEVTRHGFHTFVQRLLAHHPGIQALSWDRQVLDAERLAYEAVRRQEGYPDFQITEQSTLGQLVLAAQRPEYVVVSYIEPYVGNESALGYDVASGADRIEALQRARDTGEPSATGRVNLVQEIGQQLGLLIFLPIYDNTFPHATVEERRRNLQGYVTGVFRIGDMVEASLRAFTLDGLVLRLYDEMAPVSERLLYRRLWQAQGNPGRSFDAADGENATELHWSTTFEIAGRRLALRLSPTIEYLTARRTGYAWTTLACGLLCVGLLGAFLLILIGRAISTEQLVAERTAANATLEREIAQRQQTEEARRESEARYRELFENAHDILYTHDLAGNFTALNRAGVQLMGYTPEEILSMNISQLVVPEHCERARHTIAQKLAGTAVTPCEVDILTKHRQRRTLEVSVQLVSQAGGPIGVQGIARDITERKQLETQLLQAQKMEAIGTLAGGIAHDFNNILAAILGYTELALDYIPAGTPVCHNLQEVLVAGQRAKALVEQILTFSRQTAQEHKPLQLHLLIKEVLRFLRATLPATITFQQALDNNAGTVLADPTQIHQILMNLCTNAAHAMRETGGVLAISLERYTVTTPENELHAHLKPGPYVRLTVRDTGHGMAPEVMERIFEPFFTTKKEGEGTGMGLAVVHGIVTSHQGAITVHSTPGQGATFTVYFPHSDSAVAIAPSAAAVPTGHACILFVDDEEALTRLGQEGLQRLGYEVVGCTNSLEALDMVRVSPSRFDLVITDYTMPRLTGEALAQALRQIRPDLPIILCTGFSHAMTTDKARALGIDALCMKPLLIHELGWTVWRVLTQPVT